MRYGNTSKDTLSDSVLPGVTTLTSPVQRQSSALAFVYGIPHLCRVFQEGRLHPPGLPPVRLHQIPNHHVRLLLLRLGNGLSTGMTDMPLVLAIGNKVL
jgi:hypothetical protein